MKVEIKIYKTFDPELYALSAYGISLTKLIAIALEHYVRGEYVNFHIPRSLTYDFSLKRRAVHLAIEINDEESIQFLKKHIKPRQRTAFLKALLRGSFTTPLLGVFLSSEKDVKKDTLMIKLSEVEDLNNLQILEVNQNPRRDYTIPPKEAEQSESQENTQNQKNRGAKKSKKPKRPKDKDKRQNSLKPITSEPNNPKNQQKEYGESHNDLKENPGLQDRFGIAVNPQKTPASPLLEVVEEEDDDSDMLKGFEGLMK